MRLIKLTDEAKQKALEQFKSTLADYCGDADLTVKLKPDTLVTLEDVKKPTIFITVDAYSQMQELIAQSSKELAWHGVVTKIDHNYLINRILVYPQTVTSVTVDADETEYAKWLMQLNDDTINALRFQGHSHVGMGTSPSGRDTANWQHFLNLLKSDEFYIFCIGNKKGEYYWNIFDMAQNIIFENKDITTCVIDSLGQQIKSWASENIEKYIKDTTPNTQYHRGTVNCSSRVRTTTKKESPFKQFVPKALQDLDVDYEPDFDIYYSDTFVEGFKYSVTWGCYILEGDLCRAKYPMPKVSNKKKETKQTKKGAKK